MKKETINYVEMTDDELKAELKRQSDLIMQSRLEYENIQGILRARTKRSTKELLGKYIKHTTLSKYHHYLHATGVKEDRGSGWRMTGPGWTCYQSDGKVSFSIMDYGITVEDLKDPSSTVEFLTRSEFEAELKEWLLKVQDSFIPSKP